MKRAAVLSLMILTLAGCGYSRQDRAVSGGLIGAGAGAVLGGSVGAAVVGGAAGAAVGAVTAPENDEHHRRHHDDDY